MSARSIASCDQRWRRWQWLFAMQRGGLLLTSHIAIARYYASLASAERSASSCF